MHVSIPRDTLDAQLAWAENFVLVVATTGFASYGLTAGELGTASILTVNFRSAFDVAGVVGRLAVNPGGYTAPGRAALYTAAQAAIDTMSAFSVSIQADTSVSDSLKIAAGIVPRNFTRAPRILPQVAPTLQSKGNTPGVSLVRAYNDVGTVARPDEANGVEFERRLGVADGLGGLDFGDWSTLDEPVIGNFVRSTNPLLTVAQGLDFRGRYFGSRGQVGPWSVVLSIGNL